MISSRRIALGVLLITSGCLSAPLRTIVAQDDPHTQAKAAFERGVEHMRVERYVEASMAFEESLSFEVRASTLCNLAKAYDLRADQEAKAYETYRRCAAHPEAETYRDHAKARVYAIEQQRATRAQDSAPNTTAAEPDPSVPALRATPTQAIDRSGDRNLWSGIAVVGAVVGVGQIVGAIFLNAAASNTERRLESRYPDGRIPSHTVDGRENPDVDAFHSAEDQATAAEILGYSGLVFAVGSSLLFLVAQAGAFDERPNASVSVSFGRDSGSLHVQGTF